MCLITVLAIPAAMAQPVRLVPISNVDLAGMQALVGGLIEPVRLMYPEASLWCNENGKYSGLPRNRRATGLCLLHNDAFLDFICGDVFVSGPPDVEGYETNVPDMYVSRVESLR